MNKVCWNRYIVCKIVVFVIIVFAGTILLSYRSSGTYESEINSAFKGLLITKMQLGAEPQYFLSVNTVSEDGLDTEASVTENDITPLEEEFTVKNVADDSEIRKVYLTFDDGPSANTDAILDVLKEYDVKGNFFVIGAFSESYVNQYKRIVDEGHVMGMHSYSHNYSMLYDSKDAFIADLNHVQYVLYDITGYMPTIYRFPGGSSNLVAKLSMYEFIDILDERNIRYFDWNVNSGDADSSLISEDQIIDNVISGVKRVEQDDEYKDIMILFHDLSGKTTTVLALPTIIERLQAEGYVIAPIDDDTVEFKHHDIR